MNRTWKAVIVAVALILVGTVLAGCGLWGLDGAWDQLSGNYSMITIEETLSEDFTNLDVDVFRLDVQLALSPDGTFSYKATTYETMPCTVTVENGTLRVRQQDNRKPHQHIGINWGEPLLTLYLPQTTYENLIFQGTTSDLGVASGFRFQNANIDNTTGDVNFYGQVDGDLTVECSTGDIMLRDVAANIITASVTTGDVTVKNAACDSLTVSTTTGSCFLTDASITAYLSVVSGTGSKRLTNVTCGNLILESTSGDHSLVNVIVERDAKMESSTGDWELRGFDAANIRIEATTGDVEGTLLSDKIFFTDTTTGDVDVPHSGNGGNCEISTTTGDINIRIVP